MGKNKKKSKGRQPKIPSTGGEVEEAGKEQNSAVLDLSVLPPFCPIKDRVQLSNVGPMPSLLWAFTCNVPPLMRLPLMNGTDTHVRHSTRANQWNYSMFHLAHHYGSTPSVTKFCLSDEDDTKSILLQVTALRGLPKESCEENEQLKEKVCFETFCDPHVQTMHLGPVPIFAVKYVYLEKGMKDFRPKSPQDTIVKFYNSSPVMKIVAASLDEVEFGHKTLEYGRRLLLTATTNNYSSNAMAFQESVIFPIRLKPDTGRKVPYVCASCNATMAKGIDLKSCARCKVTYYCSRECQKNHWKAGHKLVCRPATEKSSGAVPNNNDPNRPSVIFEVDQDKRTDYQLMINNATGQLSVDGGSGPDSLTMKKEFGAQGIRMMQEPRNIHGDKEFIVKVQTPVCFAASLSQKPVKPWFCYDGPVRSFQCYIPPETDGLGKAFELLREKGIRAENQMMAGMVGYKGYFMARWEGGSVRFFNDRLVPHPGW